MRFKSDRYAVRQAYIYGPRGVTRFEDSAIEKFENWRIDYKSTEH